MFIPLKSSNLAGYEYNPKAKTLKVKFNSGRTYSYRNVEASVVSDLLNAPSAGKFFAQSIAKSYDYGED